VFQRLQVALVVALILQGTVTSLLGRYTRLSVPTKGLYDVNNFILVSECIKLLLSGLVEASHGQLLRRLREHVLEERSQFLKSSVPALLYLISNTSLYMAITHLSLSLQTGLYQARLILVAVMSYILLNRIYSLKQWCCLATLSAGVTMVALSEHTGSSAKDTDYESPNLFLGLLEMCVANVCSCAAGVYFEKVLKEDCKSIWPMARPLSMWMRNLHLSFFSLAIGILAYGWRSCSRTEAPMPFFHGFSVLVWTQAGLLAGGGLLASAILKYADSVTKAVATAVGTGLMAAVSIVLLETPVTLFFFGWGHSDYIVGLFVFKSTSNPVPSAIGVSCADVADIHSSSSYSPNLSFAMVHTKRIANAAHRKQLKFLHVVPWTAIPCIF